MYTRRGMGDTITNSGGKSIPLTGCNWVDDFGECITALLPGQSIRTPATDVTVQVTPEGSRYYQTSTGKEIFPKAQGSLDALTEWAKANPAFAIAGGGFLVILLAKMLQR